MCSKIRDKDKVWWLSQKYFEKKLLADWTKLVQMVENTCLEKNVALCLFKMHKVAYNMRNAYQSPLHKASEIGDLDLVQFILNHINPKQVKDRFSYSPIYLAAGNGHLEVVKALKLCNKNPNAKNKNWSTPLQVAAARGPVSYTHLTLPTTP